MSQLYWQELWRDAKVRLVTSSKDNTQPEGNEEDEDMKIKCSVKGNISCHHDCKFSWLIVDYFFEL